MQVWRRGDVKLVKVAVVLAGVLAAACGGGDEAAAPMPADNGTAEATPASATLSAVDVEWSLSVEREGDNVPVTLSDGANSLVVAQMSQERAQFEPWDVEFRTDLDGDGVDEAIVSHYSGGAHCCFDYFIFTAGSGGIEQADWFSLGNAGIEDVTDLDGDGVSEIVAADDRLAYFVDVPFAGSPFLPLVLCRSESGKYADCTAGFPDRLNNAGQEFEDRLVEAVGRGASIEELHGTSLGVAASFMRLGLAEDGLNQVADHCEECRTWLSDNFAELESRLNAEMPYRAQGMGQ